MKITPTAIADVLVIQPDVFADERGFFFESFNARKFKDLTRLEPHFVQDNHSRSVMNTLRGLHYQIKQSQGKLVRAVAGEVFDVVVDIRRSSPTFRQWAGIHLSAENRNMVWVPAGFAHGFVVLSDWAEVLYKTTDYWAPEYERTLLWDDTAVAIDWPLNGSPLLAAKDRAGRLLSNCETYP